MFSLTMEALVFGRLASCDPPPPVLDFVYTRGRVYLGGLSSAAQ